MGGGVPDKVPRAFFLKQGSKTRIGEGPPSENEEGGPERAMVSYIFQKNF